MPLNIGKKRAGCEGSTSVDSFASAPGDGLHLSRVHSSLVHASPIPVRVRPPKGDDWIFEPKWDGFRFQVIKDSAGVRFYSRHGAEYTAPHARGLRQAAHSCHGPAAHSGAGRNPRSLIATIVAAHASSTE